MRAAEERLHTVQRAQRAVALALPSTNGDGGDAAHVEYSADEARHIRRYLYHCSVLVERSVAAVAGCLQGVASHLEAARANGGLPESERAMVQALLQQCAVLTVRSSSQRLVGRLLHMLHLVRCTDDGNGFVAALARRGVTRRVLCRATGVPPWTPAAGVASGT